DLRTQINGCRRGRSFRLAGHRRQAPRAITVDSQTLDEDGSHRSPVPAADAGIPPRPDPPARPWDGPAPPECVPPPPANKRRNAPHAPGQRPRRHAYTWPTTPVPAAPGPYRNAASAPDLPGNAGPPPPAHQSARAAPPRVAGYRPSGDTRHVH